MLSSNSNSEIRNGHSGFNIKSFSPSETEPCSSQVISLEPNGIEIFNLTKVTNVDISKQEVKPCISKSDMSILVKDLDKSDLKSVDSKLDQAKLNLFDVQYLKCESSNINDVKYSKQKVEVLDTCASSELNISEPNTPNVNEPYGLHDGELYEDLEILEMEFYEENIHVMINDKKRILPRALEKKGNVGESIKKMSKLLLQIDKIDHAKKSKKKYACKVCAKVLTTNKNLKIHMMTHTKERLHKCEVCEKSFPYFSNLHRHLLTHNITKAFKCGICEKRYTQKDKLKMHMIKQHKPSIEEAIKTNDDTRVMKTHLCDVCNQGFKTKQILRNHLISHAEKEFLCERCGRKFANEIRLENHMLIHTDIRLYTCEICEKSYTRLLYLRKHSVLHNEQKRYTCTICQKSFALRFYLRSHMKIHSTEKCKTCTICNKIFARKHIYDAHVKNHSNEPKYKCMCGTQFYTMPVMRTHKKNCSFVTKK